MKRLYQTLLLVMLLPVGMYAQDSTAFTLKEAISYALENSNTVKNAHIDQQIADAKVKETRGIGLPQIDGTAQVVNNPQLPRMFIMAGSPFIENPPAGAELDDVVSIPNLFQLKSSGDASISASQLLFNSSYLVGLRAAKTYKELSDKTTVQTQQELIEQVAKAYYAAVINQERIRLFDSNIARVDSLLKNTRALYQNGFAESIDVDRVEVQYNNLIIERDKFIRIQQLAFELLKYQMNFPMNQPIKISDGIETVAMLKDANILEQDWTYSSRIDYSILETNYSLQKLNIQNEYSASLPSLTAFGTLGLSTGSNSFGGLFKTDTQLQTPSQYGVDKWYSYSMVGISMNVPIFSGLSRTYRIKQAKLSLQKVENSFGTLKSGIDLEINQGKLTYTNALQSMEAQNRNMVLAEKVARVTRVKFEQGVGSNLEVTDAESSLREAQINYYNALYDAVVAYIDLLSAYGRIETMK